MAEQKSVEQLAEIIYAARQTALGDTDSRALADTSQRIRRQYAWEAAEVAKHLPPVRDAEPGRLAEHATDLKLIRFAISDPGAFVKRERVHDDQYETVPAWSARAVVVALREGRGNR